MMDAPSTTFVKPAVQLVGTDGNVFALLGTCTRALRRDGLRAEASELTNRVMAAASYDDALQIMLQYVDAS